MRTGIIILIVLVVVAGTFATITYMNRGPEVSEELVHGVEHSAFPVKVLEVKPTRAIERLERTGVLQASKDVMLTAEVAGRIKKIDRRLGDSCKKGERLLQLDGSSYSIGLAQARAAVSQAEVQLDQAQRAMKRIERLRAEAVATEQQYDSAQGALDAAKAGLEQAKAAQRMAKRNVTETGVRCPFSGQVAELMVEVGQTVGPSVPLLRLVDVSELELVVNVSAAQLSRLSVGKKVHLADPRGTASAQGSISRLGVAADNTTRTFPVEIVTEGEGSALRPGQVVAAGCELQVHENAIVVPPEAVQEEDGGSSVMVVVGDVAKKKEVVLGPRIDDGTIITSGLSAGDLIVRVGKENIEDGSKVEIIDDSAKAESTDEPR